MRVVFLFFLFVNAAYFYSQSDYFGAEKAPVILKEQKLPEGVDRLTLLRERGLGVVPPAKKEKQTKPDPIEIIEEAPAEKEAKPTIKQVASVEKEPEAERVKSAQKACFTLGPFTKATTASRTAESISALGATVKRRQTSQRRPRGYWVYLPAFKTYDAANRRVKDLKQKGLKDLFIMGKGDHKNAVSLGLYKRRAAAEERFQQVKKMGLSVKMETQYQITKLAWLDMEVPGDKTSSVAEITEIADKIPRTTLAQRKCK